MFHASIISHYHAIVEEAKTEGESS